MVTSGDFFRTLRGHMDRLQKRLSRSYSHFRVWEAFRQVLAPNIVGKEKAGKNLETIKDFHNFFRFTIDAHRKVFTLELAKFFDLDRRSLSIMEVIILVKKNKDKLTLKEFEAFFKDRSDLKELRDSYIGITDIDLNNWERQLSEVGLKKPESGDSFYTEKKSLIDKLKKLRDQNLAHDDIQQDTLAISVDEIRRLFQLIMDILDAISSKLYFEILRPFEMSNEEGEETKKVIQKSQGFLRGK